MPACSWCSGTLRLSSRPVSLELHPNNPRDPLGSVPSFLSLNTTHLSPIFPALQPYILLPTCVFFWSASKQRISTEHQGHKQPAGRLAVRPQQFRKAEDRYEQWRLSPSSLVSWHHFLGTPPDCSPCSQRRAPSHNHLTDFCKTSVRHHTLSASAAPSHCQSR